MEKDAVLKEKDAAMLLKPDPASQSGDDNV